MTLIEDARELDAYDIELLSYSKKALLKELRGWKANRTRWLNPRYHRCPKVLEIAMTRMYDDVIAYIEGLLAAKDVLK